MKLVDKTMLNMNNKYIKSTMDIKPNHENSNSQYSLTEDDLLKLYYIFSCSVEKNPSSEVISENSDKSTTQFKEENSPEIKNLCTESSADSNYFSDEKVSDISYQSQNAKNADSKFSEINKTNKFHNKNQNTFSQNNRHVGAQISTNFIASILLDCNLYPKDQSLKNQHFFSNSFFCFDGSFSNPVNQISGTNTFPNNDPSKNSSKLPLVSSNNYTNESNLPTNNDSQSISGQYVSSYIEDMNQDIIEKLSDKKNNTKDNNMNNNLLQNCFFNSVEENNLVVYNNNNSVGQNTNNEQVIEPQSKVPQAYTDSNIFNNSSIYKTKPNKNNSEFGDTTQRLKNANDKRFLTSDLGANKKSFHNTSHGKNNVFINFSSDYPANTLTGILSSPKISRSISKANPKYVNDYQLHADNSSRIPNLSVSKDRTGSQSNCKLYNEGAKKNINELARYKINTGKPKENLVNINGYSKTRGRKPSTADDESKQFSCKYCEGKFGKMGHLRRHIRSLHMNHKPFNCNVCDIQFSRADNFSKHLKTYKHFKKSIRIQNKPVL